MSKYRMSPSPTQDDFIRSNLLENCIVGPRGEGKTEAGFMAMTIHANKQDPKYRPIPWAIIRDTWANLEKTTLQSLKIPHPDSFSYSIVNHPDSRYRLKILDDGHRLILPDFWECWLFGVDSLSDMNKFQSMSLGGFWLEEPAPAAMEDIGSGIADTVWSLGITSLRHPLMSKEASDFSEEVIRHKGVGHLMQSEKDEAIRLGCVYTDINGKLHIRNRRAQITMNYPDEMHWTWQRFHEQGIGKLFRIPKGENIHIDAQYRRNMAEALKNRPDLLARLVEGRPTQVQLGEAVTPEYDPEMHRAKEVLYPIADKPVIRCWDGWFHPSVCFIQFNPSMSKWVILYTLRAENKGMRQFILGDVKPFLSSEKFRNVKLWRDGGDPSIATGDQSDSTFSAAQVIMNELESRPGERAKFERGEPSWIARRECIKEQFVRNAIIISKDDILMHRAFSGGWHYHKTPTGEVIRDDPVENLYDHPAQALCHVLAKILDYRPVRQIASKGKRPSYKSLAKSYTVKSFYGEERGEMW